ncbi:hypothetical protein JCM12294_08870 [Desulfocicer niacini]
MFLGLMDLVTTWATQHRWAINGIRKACPDIAREIPASPKKIFPTQDIMCATAFSSPSKESSNMGKMDAMVMMEWV